MFTKKDSENKAVERMIDRKIGQVTNNRTNSLPGYSVSGGRGGFGSDGPVAEFILKISAYVAGVYKDVTAIKLVTKGSLITTSTDNGTVMMRNEAINDPQFWMRY